MNDKTTLLLVRHGQTEWNKESRLQGQQNSPLTKLGEQQAVAVKDSIDLTLLNNAYVSPLLRAKETINIILEKNQINPIELADLKEINLGPWEGKTKEETKQSHPSEFEQFWHNHDEFYLQGAESYAQLQNRMVGCLKDIFVRENNKTVLVVSHWIAIKVATAYFMNIPISQLNSISNISNGSFMTLISNDGIISVSQSS